MKHLAGEHRIRIARSRNLKQSLPQGSMIYAGQDHPGEEHPVFTVIQYGQDFYQETICDDLCNLKISQEINRVTWIDLNCVKYSNAVEQLARLFKLHYLTIEDVQNTDERAKVAEFDDYIIILMKMIYYDNDNDRINYEQVSFVFGANFLITFQEFEGDAFTEVRRRLQNNADIIRSKGTDYLTFSLVNAIIDGYYSVLDVFTDAIEDLELELSHSDNTDHQLQRQFHLMRYEIMLLHRAVQPLLGVSAKLNNYAGHLIPKVNKKYISDIADHISQISETITAQREILASLQDIYMANINQKMNEVMKTLTLVTTIFIPLSFIVGVYGMNFEHMPELKHPLGYFAIWGIMLAIVAGMLIIFRRKKWF